MDSSKGDSTSHRFFNGGMRLSALRLLTFPPVCIAEPVEGTRTHHSSAASTKDCARDDRESYDSDWNRHCRPSHNGEYCFFVENQWQRQHDRKGNSLSTLDFCGFSSIPLIESDFFFPFRKNLLKRLKFASSKTDSWSRQGIFPTLGGPSCTVTTPYGFSSC